MSRLVDGNAGMALARATALLRQLSDELDAPDLTLDGCTPQDVEALWQQLDALDHARNWVWVRVRSLHHDRLLRDPAYRDAHAQMLGRGQGDAP